MKNEQLTKEEDVSNDLMTEYYEKLKNLLKMKDGIKKVQESQEEMRAEQAKEEKLLFEKEHQFYLVDRLGLTILV